MYDPYLSVRDIITESAKFVHSVKSSAAPTRHQIDAARQAIEETARLCRSSADRRAWGAATASLTGSVQAAIRDEGWS
jgi:hypothetical protein